MKKISTLAAALTLAGLVGAGFGLSTSANAAYIPEGTKLAEKQELNYNQGSSPDTIDPTLSSFSSSFLIARMLFDTLVRQDSTGEYIPWAAQSYDVSPDGLTWTFHLRKEAKWSDGKPVLAKDFLYSWQRLTDPKTAATYGDYLVTANVKNAKEVFSGEKKPSELGVEASNDYTLVVHLTQPTPWLPQMLTLNVTAPLREDVITKHGENWTRPENIVTNGPFVIKEYRLNDRMDFVKNEKHWDAAHTVITKVHFDFIQNPNTSYFKYLTGEYPTTGIPVQYLKQVKQERPEELIEIQTLSTSYFKFNAAVEKLKDPRVRRALTLLVDRKFITEKILGGQTPTSILPPPGIKDAQYIHQEAWLERPQKENVEEAIKLLTEAGYSKDKPLEVTLLSSGGADSNKMYVALNGLFNKASGGLVKLDQEVVEGRTWLQRVTTEKRYEIAISGWNADYDQVSTFYNVYTCDSQLNDVAYCNPEYDKLLAQANATNDPEERAKLYVKVNEIFQRDMPVGPLWNTKFLALKSPALHGYNEKNDVRYFYDYYFIADKKVKGSK